MKITIPLYESTAAKKYIDIEDVEATVKRVIGKLVRGVKFTNRHEEIIEIDSPVILVSIECEEVSDGAVELTFRKHLKQPYSYSGSGVRFKETLSFDESSVLPYHLFETLLEDRIKENAKIKRALLL